MFSFHCDSWLTWEILCLCTVRTNALDSCWVTHGSKARSHNFSKPAEKIRRQVVEDLWTFERFERSRRIRFAVSLRYKQHRFGVWRDSVSWLIVTKQCLKNSCVPNCWVIRRWDFRKGAVSFVHREIVRDRDHVRLFITITLIGAHRAYFSQGSASVVWRTFKLTMVVSMISITKSFD